MLKPLIAMIAAAGIAGTPVAASAKRGPTAAPTRPISDRALRSYAGTRYDRAAMAFRHVVLGTQHGVVVMADFPCSDVCPQQTRRIIHLAVEPGPACAAAGGVTRQVLYPMGIAVGPRSFCVPRAVADVSEPVR